MTKHANNIGLKPSISSRQEQLIDASRAQLTTGAQTLKGQKATGLAQLKEYLVSLLVVIICTALASLIHRRFEPSNLTLIYILGVLLVASLYGRVPAFWCSISSAAALDYFFVQPYFQFVPLSQQSLVSLLVMLVVSLIISELSAQLKERAAAAEKSQLFTAALYTISRDLSQSKTIEEITAAVIRHIHDIFDCRAVTLLSIDGQLIPQGELLTLDEANLARKAWLNNHIINGQALKKNLPGYYIPLSTASSFLLGILAVIPHKSKTVIDSEQLDLLIAFANQTAVALERAQLSKAARQAELIAEKERVRNTLLSSVSHDLRTPLATITGAASVLLESSADLEQSEMYGLYTSIYQESERLNRLVSNLLDMTKLESGTMYLHKEWQNLEEIIGAALTSLDKRLSNHTIKIDLPANLPLVAVDDVLIEQVIINLLDNAVKYTQSGTTIEISAQTQKEELIVEIANYGPPLPPGDEERIFEKFYREKPLGAAPGIGLGLSICQGFVQAHGGRIWAGNHKSGKVSFYFSLPLQPAPSIQLEPLEN